MTEHAQTEGQMDFNPLGQARAREAQIRHHPVPQPGTQPFLRSVANVLVDGPRYIIVRQNLRGGEYTFDRIFHVVDLELNQRLESWTVYRRDPDWTRQPDEDAGCVLRHAIWDAHADLRRRRVHNGSVIYPTVATSTAYLPARCSDDLARVFQPLDAAIAVGATLQSRDTQPCPETRYLSLYRTFDWGTVEIKWNQCLRQSPFEQAMLSVARAIQALLDLQPDQQQTVATMKLFYDWTPFLPLA